MKIIKKFKKYYYTWKISQNYNKKKKKCLTYNIPSLHYVVIMNRTMLLALNFERHLI